MPRSRRSGVRSCRYPSSATASTLRRLLFLPFPCPGLRRRRLSECSIGAHFFPDSNEIVKPKEVAVFVVSRLQRSKYVFQKSATFPKYAYHSCLPECLALVRFLNCILYQVPPSTLGVLPVRRGQGCASPSTSSLLGLCRPLRVHAHSQYSFHPSLSSSHPVLDKPDLPRRSMREMAILVCDAVRQVNQPQPGLQLGRRVRARARASPRRI